MMDDRTEKLGAHEVAVWLRRHPNFLGQFPDLALSLVIPREDGKTASLSSYQLEILRDKNREMSRRLNELSLNAQDNERLSQHTHTLALALLRARQPADVLQALAACLKEDFSGESIRVISFTAIPGMLGDWFQQIAADDPRLQLFAECLAAGEPVCGRLSPEKLSVLFGDAPDPIQSMALIPVAGIGLIAVGSADAHRFYPGMGTLFLRWIGELFQTALLQSRR